MPFRKYQIPGYEGRSLRWYLKHHFNSAVGVVHNVEDLAALAEIHDQVAAYYCECRNKEEYITTLVKAIDQERAPIIFYDIDLNTGEAVQLQGLYEHAAVLVGYYFNEEEKLIFIISTWGQYFEFDADTLYQSAQQLPKRRTEEEQEDYCKAKFGKKQIGGWLSESWIKETKFDTTRVLKKLKETSPTKGKGCWNKILILDSKLKPGLKLEEMPVKFKRAKKVVEEKKSETLEDFTAKNPDLFKHFHFAAVTKAVDMEAEVKRDLSL